MKKNLQTLLLSFVVCATAMAQQSANTQILELNAHSFKQKVWNYEKDKIFNRIGKLPIILDFHATWCRPCKMLAPHLQTIQNKYLGKLIIYRIDVDQEPELAKLFKVQAMPTIVFMSTKSTYKSEQGYVDFAELDALVQNYFFKK